MEVVEFEPGLTAEWDAFVAEHPLAGYGHLSANFALAAQVPGLRNASLMVRDGRRTVALLPLFESRGRTLRWVPTRELVSGAFFPAGPLVALSTQGKAAAAALEALIEAVDVRGRVRGIDGVTVAYPNVSGGGPTVVRLGYSPLLHHGYQARPGVSLLLDLSRSVEQLASARKSGCRQQINKAQTSGMSTAPIRDREEWMSCHALNLHTLGELALSEGEMAAIWDHFITPGHASTRGVYLNGTLAAVTLTVQYRSTAYYWHGWRAANSANGASHFGLWNAILACREQGCRYYELGSLEFVNAKNIGISQFKQSFGGIPFQTVAARRELKPIKVAATALLEATIAAYRHRRRARSSSSTATVAPSVRPDSQSAASRAGAMRATAPAVLAKH